MAINECDLHSGQTYLHGHGMVKVTNQLIIVRRLGVLTSLLCLPSLFQAAWYVCLNRKPAPLSGDLSQILAYLAWGLSFTHPLIGIWLVSRDQLFRTWGGRFRAAIYLLVANCGWTAGSLLQDWHSGHPSEMHSAPLQFIGLATLLSLRVAVCAWLFWPLLYVFQRRLTDRQLSIEDLPRPNLRFLLAWTAFAATILTAIRLLVTYGRVMNVHMAHGNIAAATMELAIGLPMDVVTFISLTVIMIGFARRPRYWVGAVIAAVAIQFAGQQILFWTVSICADPRNYYGVLAGSWSERLPLFAGTMLVSIATFWFARVTGLVFARATSK